MQKTLVFHFLPIFGEFFSKFRGIFSLQFKKKTSKIDQKIPEPNIKLNFCSLIFSDQVYADPYGYGDAGTTNDESFLESFGAGIERTISDMSTYFWTTMDDAMNTIQGFIGKSK